MSCLDKVKFLLPVEEIEPSAMEQICTVAKMSECIKLAIMPDCHTGYDLPIGGVALMDGVIVPAFVGYDIGCGMSLIDTGIPYNTLIPCQDEEGRIFHEVYLRVPVGVGIERKKTVTRLQFESGLEDKAFDRTVNEKLNFHFGTLGGGNHFIEIGQRDDTGTLCITIHSGSRKPGWLVGEHYMKKYLGALDIQSWEGRAYIRDMKYMLQYALDNRMHMINTILQEVFNLPSVEDAERVRRQPYPMFINENHNHATIIVEQGRHMYLHRKGATPASQGELGVIPGNMRDGVYITRGRGNWDYLSSASHGAGRKMGRNQAKKTLSMENFEKQMEGITAAVCPQTLDESPDAYKDLEVVINRQRGITVDVVTKVHSRINIKGTDGRKDD